MQILPFTLSLVLQVASSRGPTHSTHDAPAPGCIRPSPLGNTHAPQVCQRIVEVIELDLVVLLPHCELAITLQVRSEVAAIGGIGYQRDLWRAFLELHGRVREQVPDLDTQRNCEHFNRVYGWISTPAFDAAHV